MSRGFCHVKCLCLVVMTVFLMGIFTAEGEARNRGPAQKGDPDFFEWEEHPEDDPWPGPFDGLKNRTPQRNTGFLGLADFVGLLNVVSSASQRDNARNDVNSPLLQLRDILIFNQNGPKSKNPGTLYRQPPK